jgi:hypothetical protein
MKLEEAYKLVAAHHRVIADVAKHYNWKDDTDLKEYTDFILHEPIQWMKGYPAKYSDVANFAKPKTAMVKLMKQSEVQTEYGEDYANKVRDAIWDAYKQLAKDQPATPEPSGPVLTIVEGEEVEAASIRTDEEGKKPLRDRNEVLATALRAFIEAEAQNHPGLAAVSLLLLDAHLSS